MIISGSSHAVDFQTVLPCGEIAGGRLTRFRRASWLRDISADISVVNVDLDADAAQSILPTYLHRTCVTLIFANWLNGTLYPSRSDKRVADGLDRVSILPGTERNLECAVLLVEHCGRLPPMDISMIRSTSLAFTPWRAFCSCRCQCEVGLSINPLHHQIGRAANAAKHGPDLIGLHPEDFHIIAEEFHDQLRSCSGHKLVDTTLNGLAETECYPRMWRRYPSSCRSGHLDPPLFSTPKRGLSIPVIGFIDTLARARCPSVQSAK